MSDLWMIYQSQTPNPSFKQIDWSPKWSSLIIISAIIQNDLNLIAIGIFESFISLTILLLNYSFELYYWSLYFVPYYQTLSLIFLNIFFIYAHKLCKMVKSWAFFDDGVMKTSEASKVLSRKLKNLFFRFQLIKSQNFPERR